MIEPKIFIPAFRPQTPPPVADVPSCWSGLEYVLPDLLARFGVGSKLALEFGVEYGFSTSALANHFDIVLGVDHWQGDIHAGSAESQNSSIERTRKELARWPNVCLCNADWKYFTASAQPDFRCNLIHIDIVHTYEDTFGCGQWSVQRAPVVIFHDTESFSDVRRAVGDLAETEGLEFWNFTGHHGLGILVRKDEL